MNRRPPLAPPPPPPPPPAPAPAPHPTTLPQQDPPPSSQIIPILPTEFARIYSITHPILILSLYYFSFPSIIANPVLALQYLLVPLSFLQLAYVVTCLPTTTTTTTSVSGRRGESGSSHFSGGALHSNPPPTTTTDTTDTTTASKKSSLSSKKKKKGKGKKVQQNGFRLSGKVVQPALLSHLLTTLLAVPVCTILLILFGGPLTTHFLHNILCASHMSLLGVLPLFYVYGVDGHIWNEIMSAILPFDEVWGGTVGTVMGAWFGAVPIPLDWDREWQKWPITIVTGAYLGWGIGSFAGGYLFRGKRIKFD